MKLRFALKSLAYGINTVRGSACLLSSAPDSGFRSMHGSHSCALLCVMEGRKEGRRGGRKGGKEIGRQGRRKGGREKGREGNREGGKEKGREGEREGGREGGRDEGRRETESTLNHASSDTLVLE